MLPSALIAIFPLLFRLAQGSESEPENCASELIRHWGYPAEVHDVTTEDGYILNLFRVPHGRKSDTNSSCTRPAILLAHGSGVCSTIFLVNPPESNPALILADAGFDVFLLNHRGTTYSKRHTALKPTDNKFWQFTMDELAKYDVPATIDTVLRISGQPSLYWVGYSQGTIVGFMALAENPTYNSKVKAMFQLGPAGTLGHGKGMMRFISIAYSTFKPVADLYRNFLGSHEANSQWRLIYQPMSQVCNFLGHEICREALHLSMGPSTRSLNWSRVPYYATYLPGGLSTWIFLHWAQIATNGRVEHMDHNPTENALRYGLATPPPYNYSLISSPVYLFWSRDDWVTTAEDVEEITGKLLRKDVVRGGREIPGYNHADFGIATDNGEMVYKPIAEIVREQEGDMCPF